MDNLKILFAVVSIGFYIYTQLRDSSKKQKQSAPQPVTREVVQTRQAESKSYSAPVSSYQRPKSTTQTPAKASKRYQSKYTKAEEMRLLLEELDGNKPKEVVREAFYKNTDNDIDPNKSLFKEKKSKDKTTVVVDEHLMPYSLQNKKKHPLLTFLSDKNNLRNGFITGEIMKRPV